MPRVRPRTDNIFCIEGDFGDKTTESGIIVKATIGKSEGVTPRWFKVFDVGPDIDYLKPGQWVYVEYGRWTEGFKIPQDDRLDPDQKIWKVEPSACMLVSDIDPSSSTLNISGSTISAIKKARD